MTQIFIYLFLQVNQIIRSYKKMTGCFKKSYKHNKSHHINNGNHYPITNHNSPFHSDKHACKTYNTNDQIKEISGQTHTCKNIKSEPEDIKDPMTLTILIETLVLYQTQNDYHKLMKLLRSN